MKKITLCFSMVLASFFSSGQKVYKIVFIGEAGVVDDYKKAKKFIVMKKYPGGSYQRLNYRKAGPLESLQTYGDSTLSFFEGEYYSYSENGNLNCKGSYRSNKKEGTWYYYNDTLKLITKEIYEDGAITRTINPDTLQKENIFTDSLEQHYSEAFFQGKQGAWAKYLKKALDPDVTRKAVRGGVVKVAFIVTESGLLEGIHLVTSVEYALDEEAIRVISISPPWQPASRNGKKVKTYRIQPITFNLGEF